MKLTALLFAFLSCFNCAKVTKAPTHPVADEPVVLVQVGEYPEVSQLVLDADLLSVAGEAAKMAGIDVVNVMDCGFINAFYSREHKAVVLCSELVNFIARTVGPEYVKPSLRFILLHELAHALVAKTSIKFPVYGESVADQFAALWLLKYGSQDDVVGAVMWFDLMTAVGIEDDPSDPHLSPERRKQDVLCLVLGSRPEENLPLTISLGLTFQKAFSCGSDYAQALGFWESIGIHLTPEAP